MSRQLQLSFNQQYAFLRDPYRVHDADVGAGPRRQILTTPPVENNAMNDFFRNSAPAVQGADAGAGPSRQILTTPPVENNAMNDFFRNFAAVPE